jgi:hypothetical protein
MPILGSVAVVGSVIGLLGTSQAGRGAASCGAWSVGGTWTTRQSNTVPAVTFDFRQTGSVVRGSAMVGPVSNNFHGTLVGTIEGDKLVFVVTWNRRTSNGQLLKGHYAGSVSSGRITGSTYALNAPEQAIWSAVGAARCR